jgi:hypothetical protein
MPLVSAIPIRVRRSRRNGGWSTPSSRSCAASKGEAEIQYSLVIDPGVSGRELVEAVDRALVAAEADGHRPFAYAQTETDDYGADTHLWFGSSEGEEVKVVEDPHMAATYLLFQGPEAETLEPYFAALGIRSAQDIRADLPGILAKVPDRLMLLVLSDSKRFDAASSNCIAHYLKDRDPDIRLAAVNAAAMAKWPQLKGDIEAMRDGETDERVLRTLDYAMAVIP